MDSTDVLREKDAMLMNWGYRPDRVWGRKWQRLESESVKVLVSQSCRLFAIPWAVPTRLLCSWDSPGKNTGMGCHFLLQGIFLNQGSNPGLPHCRQILYLLSQWLEPVSAAEYKWLIHRSPWRNQHSLGDLDAVFLSSALGKERKSILRIILIF